MPPDVDDLTRMAALINSSERPVLLIGAGVVVSGASGILRASQSARRFQ